MLKFGKCRAIVASSQTHTFASTASSRWYRATVCRSDMLERAHVYGHVCHATHQCNRVALTISVQKRDQNQLVREFVDGDV